MLVKGAPGDMTHDFHYHQLKHVHARTHTHTHEHYTSLYTLVKCMLIHDDVIKWQHFPLLASDAELWCFLWSGPWLNGWVNNHEAGDLRRHRAHYDAIVMERSYKISWKLGSGDVASFNNRTALKFDRRLGGAACEKTVKFRSDQPILDSKARDCEASR